ncbi:colicin E5-related ribonuclease [Varunaivibrio sulfuroxidans]|uniref:colicin E5-related ribonuclease n=1 Tax=Varunaivibrio sulfuroxidans TaxID=1773489 RepID=UPI00104605ED
MSRLQPTGNPATAYFRSDGHYVVRDNIITGDLVQMSNTKLPIGHGSGQWAPDRSILDPFIPEK